MDLFNFEWGKTIWLNAPLSSIYLLPLDAGLDILPIILTVGTIFFEFSNKIKCSNCFYVIELDRERYYAPCSSPLVFSYIMVQFVVSFPLFPF